MSAPSDRRVMTHAGNHQLLMWLIRETVLTCIYLREGFLVHWRVVLSRHVYAAINNQSYRQQLWRHTLGIDDILDRDRDTVQRTSLSLRDTIEMPSPLHYQILIKVCPSLYRLVPSFDSRQRRGRYFGDR